MEAVAADGGERVRELQGLHERRHGLRAPRRRLQRLSGQRGLAAAAAATAQSHQCPEGVRQVLSVDLLPPSAGSPDAAAVANRGEAVL